MAETLRKVVSWQYKNATGTKSLGGDISLAQAGAYFTQEKQTIPTSATLLDVGAAVTGDGLGGVIIRNLDENNFVSVYSDAGATHLIGIIEAADVLPIDGIDGTYVPYLKADTASVQVEFLAISKPAP